MTSIRERRVFWKIGFPNSPDFDMFLHSAEVHQTQEQHDVLILSFKGSIENHTTKKVRSGDPVVFKWATGENLEQDFVGFVHTVEKNITPNNTFTKIICMNNSELLKESSKQVHRPQTADKIVHSIAHKSGFYPEVVKHSLINESIAQAGQSHWQVMRQLASKTGYALRASNTTVIFKPKEHIINEKYRNAPVFTHYSKGARGMVSQQTLLSFTAQDSTKTPEHRSQGDLPLVLHNSDGKEYKFSPNWKTKSTSAHSVFTESPKGWNDVYGGN